MTTTKTNERYIDMGDYWLDTEAKLVPIYDENGRYAGGHFCPRIPKRILTLDLTKLK